MVGLRVELEVKQTGLVTQRPVGKSLCKMAQAKSWL